MKRVALAILLCIATLAALTGARAHTAGSTGYAAVTVQGQTVRYVLTLGVDAAQSAMAAQGDGYGSLAMTVARHVGVVADDRACAAVPGSVQPPSDARPTVVVTVDYACGSAVRRLRLTDNIFDVLGPDHHTLATITWPEGHEQLLFEPVRRDARLALAAEAEGASPGGTADNSPLAFFRLGVLHILTGYDHILFLVALMLRGGRLRSLLGIVTAFTVAHSITLALAVLGIVAIPSRIVEPVIALSIAYVTLENMVRSGVPRHRWAVGFVFGLVHGFGFAGALLELGLPPSGLVASLLFFNLGVEAGQAMIVALLFPVLLWLCRFAWERRVVTALSAVVFVAAVALVIERLLFPEA